MRRAGMTRSVTTTVAPSEVAVAGGVLPLAGTTCPVRAPLLLSPDLGMGIGMGVGVVAGVVAGVAVTGAV